MGRTREGSKVVEISGASRERRPFVTQKDLAEEELFEQEARKALKAWREKRQMIRQALKAGAWIEPGLRSAKIKTQERLIIR